MHIGVTHLRRAILIGFTSLAIVALSLSAHPAAHAASAHPASFCGSQAFSDVEIAGIEDYNTFIPCSATATQDIVITSDSTVSHPIHIQLCNATHKTCTDAQTLVSDETVIFKDVPVTDTTIGSLEGAQIFGHGYLHQRRKGLSHLGNITFNFTLFSFSPTGIQF